MPSILNQLTLQLVAMTGQTNRRDFLRKSLGLTAGMGLLSAGCRDAAQESADNQESMDSSEPLFKISLAEWSLRPLLFSPAVVAMQAGGGWSTFEEMLRSDPNSVLGGGLDPLDFAKTARSFGIDGIEYVNTFFFGRARDEAYLAEMKRRAEGEGVQSLLIMVDAEGALGDPVEAQRLQAVQNHHKWVEAAAALGCHSIRVNAQSVGNYEETQNLAADGIRRLCEFAESFSVNVIVENHGGLSSNGQWLTGVMRKIDHPLAGTLPDFGNFNLAAEGEPPDFYDRYQGVAELMPYARAVSAKATRFDVQGNEIDTDYLRMMKIVVDAGYRGFVGIEYEGEGKSATEGIMATRDLLLRVRDELVGQVA